MRAHPHDFMAAKLQEIDGIAADQGLSRDMKLLTLMHQAVRICQSSTLNQATSLSPDLFSSVQRHPLHACVTHFATLSEEGKDDTRYRPDTAITFGENRTSVLHDAYKIHTRYGNAHPALNQFMKILEQDFPEEIAESDRMEREERAYQNQRIQDAKRYKSGEIPTKSMAIFNKDHLTPTTKYILLMQHCAESHADYPVHDLAKPNENPEILTALHVMNTGKGHLLHSSNPSYAVIPNEKIPLHTEDGKKWLSAVELAATIKETQPELGAHFEYCLSQHQKKLDYRAQHPERFPQQSDYYGRNMTPQQRFEAQ